MQILGLIQREGQGTFTATEKLVRLKEATDKYESGEVLTKEEELLIEECECVAPA